MSQAIQDVTTERNRQVDKEGYDHDHDDQYETGELAIAGYCYANHAVYRIRHGEKIKLKTPINWPWSGEFWKPKNPRQDLVRSAALIIAEIERIDRRA